MIVAHAAAIVLRTAAIGVAVVGVAVIAVITVV
jgi:hypothetical protein